MTIGYFIIINIMVGTQKVKDFFLTFTPRMIMFTHCFYGWNFDVNELQGGYFR